MTADQIMASVARLVALQDAHNARKRHGRTKCALEALRKATHAALGGGNG